MVGVCALLPSAASRLPFGFFGMVCMHAHAYTHAYMHTHAPSPMECDIEWKKGELIGKGSFGKVYMGMNIKTGELLAVKQVRLNTSEARARRACRRVRACVRALGGRTNERGPKQRARVTERERESERERVRERE